MTKISAVINTLNEEKNIKRAINSVSWADEVIVCDMYSDDKTAQLAKKLGAKVFYHKKTGYVEPARNFAISRTSGDWILILDADEEIPESLAKTLKKLADKPAASDFVEIPRKNIIFGKWMKTSMWWPDYNIRFFKKKSVVWTDKIHRPPQTRGTGLKLEATEENSITHYHYQNISQFIERMNRYTSIQSQELINDGYKFIWADLIRKPLSEFLSRFFANRGFEDGLHGLALSLLQAFSQLLVYLKVWEKEKFKEQDFVIVDVKSETEKAGLEIDYWFKHAQVSSNLFKRFFQKTRNKLF